MQFINFFFHFCHHTIPAQLMICLVHLIKVFIGIRWDTALFHVLCVIFDQLYTKQEHGSLAVCVPVLFLVLLKPDDISQDHRQNNGVGLHKYFFQYFTLSPVAPAQIYFSLKDLIRLKQVKLFYLFLLLTYQLFFDWLDV